MHTSVWSIRTTLLLYCLFFDYFISKESSMPLSQDDGANPPSTKIPLDPLPIYLDIAT